MQLLQDKVMCLLDICFVLCKVWPIVGIQHTVGNCMNFFMTHVLFHAIKEGKQSRLHRLCWLLNFLSFFINTDKTGLIALESSNKVRRLSRRWLGPFIKSISVIVTGRDPNNLKWLALGNHKDRTQPNSEMQQCVKSHCVLIWWPTGEIFLPHQIL